MQNTILCILLFFCIPLGLSTAMMVFFEMAGFPKHSLKLPGLTELTTELPPSARKNIHIVFVAPVNIKFTKKIKPRDITVLGYYLSAGPIKG